MVFVEVGLIVSRIEFANIFNENDLELGNEDSPLWKAEHGMLLRCQWFIKVSPIDFSCRDAYNLKGITRCFSSGSEECGDLLIKMTYCYGY